MMQKIAHSYNRASYENNTRISKAQVAFKVGYVDLSLSTNVKFYNRRPTEAEFNSLVAQVIKDKDYATKPIRSAAAHVVRIYSSQFNINLSDRFDQLNRSLRGKFNEKP